MIKIKEQLKFSPKIVAIGGGTGLSSILKGIKDYTNNITAVVTVADDGGGSGALRQELKMPPPGDIRNCILALAETEPIMEKLIQYRFNSGSLRGQSFGNLFLAAMTGIYDGDFVRAVKNVADVLKVSGEVLPVTSTDVRLVANMQNGEHIKGESSVGTACTKCGCRISSVNLEATDHTKKISPLPEVLECINNADLIAIGPGSLYTSIIPSLIVDGVSEALCNSKAPVVYINNIMTQSGETDGYTAFDHVEAISKHTSREILDYCIVNNGAIPPEILQRYKDEGAEVTIPDTEKFKNTNIEVVQRNLISFGSNGVVRHNARLVADILLDIVNKTSEKRGISVSDEGVVLYKPKHRG